MEYERGEVENTLFMGGETCKSPPLSVINYNALIRNDPLGL